MGCCVSTADMAEKERRDLIDKLLEEDSKKYKRECKILLLGSGESGKSTVVKQMKILYQGGYSATELLEFRPIIFRNAIESAQAVLRYMRKLGLDYDDLPNRAFADKILACRVEGQVELDTAIATAIHQVWKDPAIPKVMDEHLSDFYLMDSAPYFFAEVLRIGTPGYMPNEKDVLHAWQKSLGIIETRFTAGALPIHMLEVGGQCSEFNEWIQCFESLNGIIFCTALSEYDQVLLEEKTQSRMTESLILFESIINSRWLLCTSIILFLNKIDVFKRKLPKVPLENFFPEYTGGADVNKAAKHVLSKFIQVNKAQLSVYPHLTQATDTQNIRLVFAAAKETILQNALKDSGIL